MLAIPPKSKTKTKVFALKQRLFSQFEKSAYKMVNWLLCSIKYAQTSFEKAVQILTIAVMSPAFIHVFTLRYLAITQTSHTPVIITVATIKPMCIPSGSPKWMQTSTIVK